MAKTVEEKRRYLRLNNALQIEYVLPGSDKIHTAMTKDISALGLRIVSAEEVEPGSGVEIKFRLPNTQSAVHTSGRVVWSKKSSLEDSAAYETGIEFLKIEEDNKNTFLKYLCDLIYG